MAMHWIRQSILDRRSRRSGPTAAPRRRKAYPTAGLEQLETRQLMTTPTVTLFPTSVANSATSRLVTGFDQNLWFTDPGANAVGSINPTTQAITEFPLPTPGADPHGIVESHDDGKMWFTESSAAGNAIASINLQTYAISEYKLPSPDCGPTEIVENQLDGNLYITENNLNSIIAFNPITHAFGTLDNPGEQGTPGAITMGGGFTVWFTESQDPGKVGFIDPVSFLTTDFSTPTPNSQPGGMSRAIGGALWFTEGAANQVASIDTTTDAFTEVALPANPNDPMGLRGASRITLGPGVGSAVNLFFTEGLSQDIGEIDPTTHALTFIPVPNASPDDITIGSDGNLWFTAGPYLGTIQFNQTTAATTTTTVSSTLNPASVGQPVTFTAVVEPSLSGGVLNGTATFSIDGAAQPAVGVSLVNGVYQATLTTSTLGAGNHAVTAAYNGDSTFAGSTGNTVNQVVNAVIPVTSLLEITAAATTATVDSRDTFTVHVSGNAGTPTGSITFTLDGQQPTVVPLTRDEAQIQTFGLTAGTHTVAASYSGDDSYLSSHLSIDVNIVPSDTVTTMETSSTNSIVGQPVRFYFDVVPQYVTITVPVLVNPADTPLLSSDGSGHLPTLSGHFTLTTGSSEITTLSAAPDGSASFTMSTLPEGSNTFSAIFGSDPNYNPSSARTATVVVRPVSTPTPTATPAPTSTTVPASTPPTRVVGVTRHGFHAMPTVLIVQFDGSLNAESAENLANYKIIGADRKKKLIASAVYDASRKTVTLTPVTHLDLHKTYRLTINNNGSGAITDVAGHAIDGSGNGTAGSDYTTELTASNLVIFGHNAKAKKTLAGIIARENRAHTKVRYH